MVTQLYTIIKCQKYSLISGETYGPDICMLNMYWQTIIYRNVHEKSHVWKLITDDIFKQFMCIYIYYCRDDYMPVLLKVMKTYIYY